MSALPEGLATAREDYLRAHPELDQSLLTPGQYLSTMYVAVKRMDPRNQSKLRHPARSRAEAQLLLEGQRI